MIAQSRSIIILKTYLLFQMEHIKELRGRIDEIDREIVGLIEERVKTAKEIGEVKRRNGIDIEDSEREAEIMENVTCSSLDKKFTECVFRKIIEYCKNEE